MKGLKCERKLENSNNLYAHNLSGGSLRTKSHWRAWNIEMEGGKIENFQHYPESRNTESRTKKTNPREINSVALKNVGFGLQPLKFASPVTLGELLKLWFLHFHIYLLGRTSSWTLPHGAAQSINELI